MTSIVDVDEFILGEREKDKTRKLIMLREKMVLMLLN